MTVVFVFWFAQAGPTLIHFVYYLLSVSFLLGSLPCGLRACGRVESTSLRYDTIELESYEHSDTQDESPEVGSSNSSQEI